MKKLRLLLTEDCNRHCIGCCNNDWSLQHLPIAKSFKGYDEVLITGGEPMLYPFDILQCINRIKKQSSTKIYLYTALLTKIETIINILELIDGITVTLHTMNDVGDFYQFHNYLCHICSKTYLSTKSMRLNIFKNINVVVDRNIWKVKDNIEWIKNCPLPQGETFMRYKKERIGG